MVAVRSSNSVGFKIKTPAPPLEIRGSKLCGRGYAPRPPRVPHYFLELTGLFPANLHGVGHEQSQQLATPRLQLFGWNHQSQPKAAVIELVFGDRRRFSLPRKKSS